MTGALALVAALVTSQIQTHPTGLKTVGLSHKRGSVRTVQILDKLREQAGMPSLDLDFARYGDLNDNATGATSLVTFSRSAASSPGTYVGSDGLIKTAAVNLQLYSEEFDQWTNSNTTDLANQTDAPDGKQTADEITASAANGTIVRGVTTTAISYTFSVYLKRKTGTGNIDISVDGSTWVTQSVTGDWQRFSVTQTGVAGTSNAGIRLVTSGDEVYAWGAQLQEGTVATPYIRTTSQALAAPRFDHDPLTGESLGLLVEEARTNLLTDSEDMSAAGWGGRGFSGAVDLGSTGPLGAQAWRFDENDTDNNPAVYFSPNVTDGTPRTFSVWLKGSFSDSIAFSTQGNSKDTDILLTTDWQKFTVTSSFNGGTGPHIGGFNTITRASGLSIYVAMPQLEAGSFPTSYIPTAGTSLTRAADVATVEGTDFSSWYNASEGTILAKFRSPTVATRGIVSLDDNTANEAIALQSFYSTGTQLVVTDGGTQQVNTAASIITDDAAYTGVAAYKASDFAVATAGDVAIDVAGTIPTVDRMRIGVNQGGDYLNGHIARLAYWPVRKTNDVLDLISDPVPNNDYQILVKTDNTGTSNNDQFTIPANAGTYDVDWGDGTTSTGLTGAQTHTYPAAGQYVIRMDGITHYYTNNTGDKLKLLDVQNWGNEAWTSMQRAYKGCSNMIMSATDAPDLSGVTSMLELFAGAVLFNGAIGHWDVSSVASMRSMFSSATAFNQPIGSWDVSNVTDMGSMLYGASAFNQPIGNWDMSNVTDMSFMFILATSFNQPIGNWDVSSVTTMYAMFQNATAFNQPIGDWDVSSVTTMLQMFRNTSAFNQPINGWDVSNVTTMYQMFRDATAFNQPIGNWNVSSVTDYINFMLNKTNLNYDAANLDAIYNGWIANELSPSESIDFGTIKYTAAGAEGRALLTRANATVAVSNAVDNGSGLVRLTTAAHGLTTGNKVYIKGIVGTTEANGLHTVTVIDATTIDLQGTAFTNAYTSGGTVRTGYGWAITDGGI